MSPYVNCQYQSHSQLIFVTNLLFSITNPGNLHDNDQCVQGTSIWWRHLLCPGSVAGLIIIIIIITTPTATTTTNDNKNDSLSVFKNRLVLKRINIFVFTDLWQQKQNKDGSLSTKRQVYFLRGRFSSRNHEFSIKIKLSLNLSLIILRHRSAGKLRLLYNKKTTSNGRFIHPNVFWVNLVTASVVEKHIYFMDSCRTCT